MDLSQEPAPSLVSRRPWRDDRAPLALAGVALIGLGLVLGFLELALPLESLLVFAAAAALATVVIGPPAIASGAIVAVSVIGTVWHAATPLLPLTLALLGCGAAGVLHVALHGRSRADDEAGPRAAWIAGAVAVLAASFAGYYHFVTLGFGAEASVRRVVITLAWMVAGIVAMALADGRRGVRDAGLLFVLVALGKTLAYDVTHLGGLERIALLLLAGGALLVGARTVRPQVTA